MSEEEREPADTVLDHLTNDPAESEGSASESRVDHDGPHLTVTVGLTGELDPDVGDDPETSEKTPER